MITESDSEDEGSPKKKTVRMIVESDSEDLSKKKPVRMIVESDSEDEDSTKKNPSQTNDEKTIDMRNLYDFNDVDNKKSRKFRTESHVFTASFKRFQDLRPHQLNALFDDVTQQIKQKLNAEPSDMIRLSINHPSLDMGIHIPFMCADQLEGAVLLDQIEKVSQSNTEFKLNDGLLKMDITHTKPPRGSGKPKRLTTELDSKVFAQKKRSIIQINNTEDNICFARAVVVGMCYSERENTETWNKRWKYIKKSDRPLQKTEAEKLLEEAGVSPSQPIGVNEYKQIQALLYKKNYVIKVHNQHSKAEKLFEHPPVTSESKIIHVYFHQKHYDYIKSMPGFLGCAYYCEFYDVGYKNRESHVCPHICKGCYRIGKCASESKEYNCFRCHRRFFSAECMKNHRIVQGNEKKSICDLVKLCTKCGQQIEVRKKNHVCKGKKKCHICKQIVDFSHRCYIQPYQSKMNHDSDDEESASYVKKPLFIFFDFECSQDTGVHIPNYCIAHRACDLCIDKPLDFHCSTCSEFEEGREVIFQGEETLSKFCNWLFSKQHKGITGIAHNLKGYDGQFILNHIIKVGLKTPKLIMNGNNIMKLEFNGVRLIDSFNFMNFGLAKFPATFGLQEMKKGYFPHWANTDKYWNYIGPYLDMSFYRPDSMREESREQFISWYNEKVQKGEEFNFQKEMESYCRSDVDILRRGCGEFRKVFMEHGGICPFLEAITIADACNKVWRSKYLPENEIAIISSKDSSRRRFSMKAIRWIQSLAKEKGIVIHHAKNGGEVQIGNYHVDGFHKESKIVYEFLGDLYHGCPVCYTNRNQINPFNGKSMSELHECTIKRSEDIRKMGYNVDFIWEHDFDDKMKKDKEYKKVIESLYPHCDPIDPREPLSGGRCNAIKIMYDVNENSNKEIKYIDICSLYPYVCKHKSYPVGQPKILTPENIDMGNIRQYEGIIKCKVLPPDDLFHPILPVHCNGKMMFPLCMKCAEDSSVKCSHSKEERSLVGTWVTFELFKALDCGYRLMQVYEIWHFDSVSPHFFKGYVDNFLKIKQEASGYPGWCQSDSEKEKFVRDYEEAEGIRLDPSNIQKNPGKRNFAKIMLNCLWGKLAQREKMTHTEYISKPSQYFDLISNSNIIVKNVEIFDNECPFILVNYETKLEHIDTHATANVIVGSYVTAYARLELYKVLEKLQKRVLYFDTDSCMYIHDPKLWNPRIINSRLGKWTDEEPDCKIIRFRGLGPKNYAYMKKTKDGEVETKCKVKGITLDYKTSQIVNFDLYSRCAQDRSTEIEIRYDCRIKRNKDRTVISEPQTKTFRSVYSKRVIINETDTVPYGYKSLRE